MTGQVPQAPATGPARSGARAPVPIPLSVVGCDFRRASSRWRSRLVLDEAELRAFHEELRATGSVDGLVALQTCNRNEWISAGTNPSWAAGLLSAQMKHRVGAVTASWFLPYVHTGEDALRHLFRVALGR